MQLRSVFVVFPILLIGCNQATEPASIEEATAPTAGAADAPSVYAIAVSNAARSESDTARDAGRKPASVLEFFGIEPAQKFIMREQMIETLGLGEAV